MKGRIVDSLHRFSKGGAELVEDPLFQDLRNILDLSSENLITLSEQRLKDILHNYAFFDVVTIDKFTHRLIRTFAKDLKLPPNFEVVLDTDSLLQEGVERLVAKAGQDEPLTQILVDYALSKIEGDYSWNITQDLRAMGKQMFVEANNAHFESLGKKRQREFLLLKKELVKKIESPKLKNTLKGRGDP